MSNLAVVLGGVPGRAAVYARNLTTGAEVAHDADRLVPTGSAAKTFVMLTYAERVSAGDLDPSRRVVLTSPDEHGIGGSGVLRYLSPGLEPTLDDCAWLMMIISDNVATDLLLDAVGGPDAVNATLRRLGIDDAQIESPSVWVYPPKQFGRSSARALARSWEVLANPAAHGYPPDAAERCLRITSRHQLQNGFARHLPWNMYAVDFGFTAKVRLWSKGGSYPGVQCEAGLFETDAARWVLSVMLDELADQRAGAAGPASTAIADVSKLLYDEWVA